EILFLALHRYGYECLRFLTHVEQYLDLYTEQDENGLLQIHLAKQPENHGQYIDRQYDNRYFSLACFQNPFDADYQDSQQLQGHVYSIPSQYAVMFHLRNGQPLWAVRPGHKNLLLL